MVIRKNKYWKYKNLTLVFAGIAAGALLFKNESFSSFLIHLGKFGYAGSFFAGVLFVSSFTMAIGITVLVVLAETLSPLEIGLVAGIGAVFGDLMVFKLVKNNLSAELKDIYNGIDSKHHLKKLLHLKFFNWLLPVVGAAIIASPLPDELGVSLIGVSKMSTSKFILISYLLNSIGIFIVVYSAAILK